MAAKKVIELGLFKSKSQDQFLSMTCHELKTPLTGLKLQHEILLRMTQKEGVVTWEDLRPCIERSSKLLDRVIRLVNDILDTERASSGRVVMECEKVRLSELIFESVDRLQEQFSDESYPRIFVHENLEGHWDRLRLEQVLSNILMNSIKYGNNTPIDISVRRVGEAAQISVQDYGPGIAANMLEKVFNCFERGNYASKSLGLGLGLFISKSIIEAHGGKIWAEAELGKGATFHILIPLQLSSEC